MNSLNKDALYEITKNLEAIWFFELPKINKYYSNMFRDDEVWRNKLYYHYPNYEGPTVKTFKNTCLAINKGKLKPFDVFLYNTTKDNKIGTTWVFDDLTYNELVKHVQQLYNKVVPANEQYKDWVLSNDYILCQGNTKIEPLWWTGDKNLCIKQCMFSIKYV